MYMYRQKALPYTPLARLLTSSEVGTLYPATWGRGKGGGMGSWYMYLQLQVQVIVTVKQLGWAGTIVSTITLVSTQEHVHVFTHTLYASLSLSTLLIIGVYLFSTV